METEQILKTEQLLKSHVTLKEVRHDSRIKTYITRANEQMQAIGYTEHGHRHAGIVSTIARTILTSAMPSWPPLPAICMTWGAWSIVLAMSRRER